MSFVGSASEIRPLGRDCDPARFAVLARLYADAYPIMKLTTGEAIDAFAQRLSDGVREEHTQLVVAERGGTIDGAMRLYDYRMNVRGRDALAGGVGALAVAPASRRRGVARALLTWYLEHYRERGASFAVLHPFRPDFYRALGFGYGTPVQRYGFAPATLRAAGARGDARLLERLDAERLDACAERVRSRTNGLIARHRWATERALSDPALRYVGVEDAGVLRAFMQTSVAVGAETLRNRDELIVRDVTYEDGAYLAALLAYLRSQRDQFARVVIETQDAALYLAGDDPRDGSDEAVAPPAAHRIATTGLGMMYRILDVDRAFGHLPPARAPFALRLTIDDPFVPALARSRTFLFGPAGPPRRSDEAAADASLTLGIAELSSLVVGSLRLRDVVRHRLATLEPPHRLGEIDAALAADQPPVCNTRF